MPSNLKSFLRKNADNKMADVANNVNTQYSGRVKTEYSYQGMYLLSYNTTLSSIYSLDKVVVVYSITMTNVQTGASQSGFDQITASSVNSEYINKTNPYLSEVMLRDSSSNYVTDANQIISTL